MKKKNTLSTDANEFVIIDDKKNQYNNLDYKTQTKQY